MTPDTLDQLDALWRKFDSYPEAAFPDSGGALLKTGAYVAFLDARQLIEKLRHELHTEIKGWRPIATYFDAEPETPAVLLWGPHPVSGEDAVMLGYWDEDERAWYREGEGPDIESAPIEPTKFMAVGELMRAAEFVAIERLSE
jgi:hypothetical protein